MTEHGQNTEEMKTEDVPTADGDVCQDKTPSAVEEAEEKACPAPELAALTEQLSMEKDRVLRLSAEFENYKKRKQREIDEFKKFANETVFKQLLSVVDNLERAVAAASRNQGQEEEKAEKSGLLDGVKMIHKEIMTIFENFHVRPVEAQDQPFDHNLHQAVTQEETQEVPDKTVVRVLQKGYSFHDRLLRPAMVVVSRKPADAK